MRKESVSRLDERRHLFSSLHTASTGFVMPNAWDAGSAVILAEVGFPAIATTSAGIAFSLARPDYDARHANLAVTRREMMQRARQIVRAVDVPVSGDLEAGYGDAPHDVAATIQFAIDAGLAGANIEDKNPRTGLLYDESLAVERITAAREVIDTAGVKFVLTARTDGFLVDVNDPLSVSIRRANRFRAAGADCLFPAGARDIETVKTLVREIDGPINIVSGLGRARLDPNALIDAGVRRVSLGGSIARAMLGFVRRSAQELRERGSIAFTHLQIDQPELNALFAESARARSAERGRPEHALAPEV